MAIMCCLRVQPGREMTVEEFKRWLSRYDADHDGSISTAELEEALRSLHVWFRWWKAREGMREADADHNGRLDNPKEIEKLVRYAQQRLHLKIYENN